MKQERIDELREHRNNQELTWSCIYAFSDVIDELLDEIERYQAAHETAQVLINAAVEIMTPEQDGQWKGVRTFQEMPIEGYAPEAQDE